jgi:hypothetical protein
MFAVVATDYRFIAYYGFLETKEFISIYMEIT